MRRRGHTMVVCLLMIPALSPVWFSTSTPQNHSFRVDVVMGLYVAVLLLFAARFRCPRCLHYFSNLSEGALHGSVPYACPHCRVNIDEPMEIRGTRK